MLIRWPKRLVCSGSTGRVGVRTEAEVHVARVSGGREREDPRMMDAEPSCAKDTAGEGGNSGVETLFPTGSGSTT